MNSLRALLTQLERTKMELSELNLSEEQLENVKKIIQGAEDRVRTDYSKKLKDTTSELAKYKPNEKSDAEKQLEEKMKELELKEKELNNKTKIYEVEGKLSELGLPKELGKFLNIGDNIDESIKEVGTCVNSYFLNNGSKPNTHSKQQGVTKEQFKSMSYGERAKLLQTNPDLYNMLSN